MMSRVGPGDRGPAPRHLRGTMKELAGKTAVVTGAASGIGRAMAERWAAAGMNVVLADIDEAALDVAVAEVSEVGPATGLRVDVTVASDVEARVLEVVAQAGHHQGERVEARQKARRVHALGALLLRLSASSPAPPPRATVLNTAQHSRLLDPAE